MAANLAPVQFESDWDYSGGVLYNTALSLANPLGGTARRRDTALHAAGALHEHVPAQRQRLAAAGATTRSRWAAAGSGTA